MATPLTWRNVDAPDFRGSMDGLRLAGGAMDRAFSGLSDGLGKFQDYRKDQAESAVLNSAMGFSDPEQLRQAIANGQVFQGVDRSLLGRQALTALNNQAGTLLNQAVTQESLGHDREMNPLLRERQGLDNRFNQDTLGARVQTALLAPAQAQANIDSSRASTDATKQRTQQSGVLFNRGTQAYTDEQAGQAAALAAARAAVDQPGGIANLEANLDPNLNYRARAYALSLLPGYLQGFNPATGGVGGTGVPPGSAPAGGAAQPRGLRNNNPLNIEAGGFTQGQAGYLGSDGRFARFETPEQGLAAADALLQGYASRGLNTPSAIINRWAPSSDGNNVPAYAANVARKLGIGVNDRIDMADPAQRRKLIEAMAQEENGQPLPADLGAQASRAISNATTRSQQSGAAGGQGQYAPGMADTASSAAVEADRLGKLSVFKDVPPERLAQEIAHVRQRAVTLGGPEISFALASRILENTATRDSGWFWKGVDRNDSAITQELQRVANGDRQQGELDIAGNQAAAALLEQRRTAASAAEAERKRIEVLAGDRPALRETALPRTQRAEALAKELLAQAVSGIKRSPRQQPLGRPIEGEQSPGGTSASGGAGERFTAAPANYRPDPLPMAPVDTGSPAPTTPAPAAIISSAAAATTRSNADPLEDVLRRAAEDRQRVTALDDQVRAARTSERRSALVNEAAADAMELMNTGKSAAEAIRLAVTSSTMRGRGITEADIATALRQR